MHIDDIMDCEGCKACIKKEVHDGWYTKECALGEDVICDRMKGAVYDVVTDGQLQTERGDFWHSSALKDKKEIKELYGIEDYDFSSARYYWIPHSGNVGEIVPYKNEEEILREWFI